MKKMILLLLLLFHASFTFAYEVTENEKMASLCKVWGFLKYFHPAVGEGSINWDTVFVSEVKALAPLQTSEAVSRHFIELIAGLGDVKKYPAQALTFDTACNFNKPLASLLNTKLLSAELFALLKDIAIHRTTDNNRFVTKDKRNAGAPKFTNEAVYEDMVFPAKEYRLLSMARYWNIIEYYFPYKHLTDEPWDDVLTEMVPKCGGAKDTLEYRRALTELVAKVNDSHANLSAAYKSNSRRWFMPLRVKIIDDKAIITELENDSLCRLNDLQVGDVILAINDTTVKEAIAGLRKYIGASNEAVMKRNMGVVITGGRNAICKVTFDRNGVVSTKTVYRYPVEDLDRNKIEKQWEQPWKITDKNIGFINMGKLMPKHVNKALKDLSGTRGIIFDQRNYPNWTIYELCSVLSREKHPFVKFSTPDYSYPGTFICEKPTQCGKSRNNGYEGRIVILINEQTQSQAEFTTMALRSLPNAVTIGSQTAGADGNVATIVFPGNYKTLMTSLGVYYPDGRQTQRIGIVPDIHSEPTIEGLRQHRDEVLERAIQYIETGK